VRPQRPVPSAWILSLPILIFGMTFGFMIVSLPQMLAAQGVPGGRIARTVAIITSPAFFGFLLAPFLDVRFSRRTYALFFGVLAAAATAFAVFLHAANPEVDAVMLIGCTSIVLFGYTISSWGGSLIGESQRSHLGAWNTAFNIGGGGIGILFSGYVTQRFPAAGAAALIFIVFLVPLLVLPAIPVPPPGGTLVNGGFGRFMREIASLLKRREVLVALSLFMLPAASFALTNILGGWGNSFSASPGLVTILGGAGSVAAGLIGSLLVPIFAKRLPLRPLYLSIGLIGAAFTLGLLLFPQTSWTYGTAFIGENIFQAAAFSIALAIIFEVIGPGNPLAATIFALLSAAMNFPGTYMAVIDGYGYDWRAINGAFLADGVVSAGACILLVILFRRWLFRPVPQGSTPIVDLS
jgi:MFS transporter, PAT family, beta-lactamase induction signal transducer AmpG